MATKILIPTPLRPYTDKKAAVDADGSTVGELLADLTRKHTGLKAHLYNDQGKLRSFVNVYVNDEDIRYLQKEHTPVSAADTVSIIPSVAGGVEKGTGVFSTGAVAEKTPVPFSTRDLPPLTNEEVKRYSRHLIMPEVGMDGQRRMKAGRVLCIGAGGLGSPAALYLAAAGVGTIGVVDFDTVDFSNLQRQIIHGTPDVGRSKLASAKDRINAINPHVDVQTYEVALSSENALKLFEPYDVILDGTDNFPTRYLTNDACVLLRKPNAYGCIFRFEGQASVFATKEGPCYRCLYPEPPPPGLVPSCAEGGVLGVLPGVIGVIQATEAIQLVTGIGEPLIGRFLIYDALKMRFRELKQRLDRGDQLTLVDVREPNEYQINRIPGTVLIPLGEVPRRYAELDKDAEIVVHCKMGGRSAKAADFLRSVGFKRVLNLKGGILDWIDKVDPSQPKY